MFIAQRQNDNLQHNKKQNNIEFNSNDILKLNNKPLYPVVENNTYQSETSQRLKSMIDETININNGINTNNFPLFKLARNYPPVSNGM